MKITTVRPWLWLVFILFVSSAFFAAPFASPVSAAAAAKKTTATAVKKTTAKKVVAKKKTAPKKKITVSAIPGADERKVFPNPVTRCLTAQMKAIHQKAQAQMETDIATLGVDRPNASTNYRHKLAIAWSAMSEPYCGYGSRGVTAVRVSFSRSMERARAEFLNALKKSDDTIRVIYFPTGASSAIKSALDSAPDRELTPAELTKLSPSTPLNLVMASSTK